MKEKLEPILHRYKELETQLNDPDGISNSEKLAKISKEKAMIEADAKKIERYFQILKSFKVICDGVNASQIKQVYNNSKSLYFK